MNLFENKLPVRLIERLEQRMNYVLFPDVWYTSTKECIVSITESDSITEAIVHVKNTGAMVFSVQKEGSESDIAWEGDLPF